MGKIKNQVIDEVADLEELTSTGEGSGLEAERPDLTINTPFDPTLIDVVTQPYTIDLLISRLDDDALNLSPEFQRRGNLWTETRQSQLIESLMLKIPLPSLYVSEDTTGVFHVVDGLQRLSAISRFLNPKLLTAKLGIPIRPLRLQGLESLREFEGKTFQELPKALQRRIRETQLTLHVIRAGTPNEVKFNVFARINQGGLPLTAQEIRNALYPGPAKEWLNKMASEPPFLHATQGKIKRERMGDVELMLRFAALSDSPSGREDNLTLDEFLNRSMTTLNTWDNSQWEKLLTRFRKAMEAAPRVFGRHAFRKLHNIDGWRSPINRGLFEAEAVALSRVADDNIDKLAKNQKTVLKGLIDLLTHDEAFKVSLLYATGSASATNTRLRTVQELFQRVLCAP